MKQSTDSNYNFLLTGAATHVGQVRKANEDSMAEFESSGMRIFVVCDGMGGHVGGQIASQTAITAIRNYFVNNISLDPRETIYSAIVAANEAILNRVLVQPELGGMGSTCVILVVTGDGKVYYGHVGDSRIYIIANHCITQLTKDHSVVQELFDNGIIKNREDMERHPRKNEITNALGLQDMKPPTICNAPIEPDSGNCFLLCSDGLTNMVDDEQIKRIISKHTIPLQQRAEKLVQMANANGGIDNITVQLVEFAVGVRDINKSNFKRTEKWKRILPLILLAIIIISGLTWWYLSKRSLVTSTEAEITADNIGEIQYMTNAIIFTSINNEPVTTEIQNFHDGDTIRLSSISKSDFINVLKTEGKYITLKWKNEPKNDTITLLCQTLLADSCMIKIPVSIIKHDTMVITETKTVKVESISFGDALSLDKKSYKGIVLLSDNSRLKDLKWSADQRELESSMDVIKADLTDYKTGKVCIEWIRKNQDDELPDKVTITCKTTSDDIYHITFSLKLDEAGETTE